MTAPAWVQMPSLTKRERELFLHWHEVVRRLAEREGRKIHLYSEAYPVLLHLSFEHFPKLERHDRQRRVALLTKLAKEFDRQTGGVFAMDGRKEMVGLRQIGKRWAREGTA